MDTRRLLLTQHALLHSHAVGGAGASQILPDAVWDRLSESQMREQLPGHNPLAWLLWHIARSEDHSMNRMIRGVPEVFDRDGWARRLGAPVRYLGTGMCEADVADLSRRVDLGALLAYRDAVGLETRTWLEAGDLSRLDDLVDGATERIAQSGNHPAEVLGAMTRAGLYEGRTGISYLARGPLLHTPVHLGECIHVIESLGVAIYPAPPRE